MQVLPARRQRSAQLEESVASVLQVVQSPRAPHVFVGLEGGGGGGGGGGCGTEVSGPGAFAGGTAPPSLPLPFSRSSIPESAVHAVASASAGNASERSQRRIRTSPSRPRRR